MLRAAVPEAAEAWVVTGAARARLRCWVDLQAPVEQVVKRVDSVAQLPVQRLSNRLLSDNRSM